jgi:hypothetical protein
MKRIILILTFIFITFTGFTQSIWTLPQFLGGAKNLVTVPGGLRVPNGLIMGTFADTNILNLNSSKFYEGSYADVAGILHRRTNDRWVSIAGVSVTSYSKNITRDSTVLLLSNGTRFAAKDSLGSGGTYPGNIDTTFSSTNAFTQQTVPPGVTYSRVVRSEPLDLFLATSSSGPTTYITSPDGINWTQRNFSGIGTSIRRIIWVPRLNRFILSIRDSIYSSTNGTTFTFTTAVSTLNRTSRVLVDAASIGLLVFVTSDGFNSFIHTSPDGIVWTQRTHPAYALPVWNDLEWSPELNLFVGVTSFVGTSSGSRYITSSDGINWNIVVPATSSFTSWSSVTWSPILSRFFAYTNERVAFSSNGITWTEQGLVSPSLVKYDRDRNIFEGMSGNIYQNSIDGLNFYQAAPSPSSLTFGTTAYSPTRKVTVLAGNGIVALQQGAVGLFSASKDGLVPRSAGGTLNFLRADGHWVPQEVTSTNTQRLSNKDIVKRSVTATYGAGTWPISYSNRDVANMLFNSAATISAIIFASPILPPYEGQEYTLKIVDDGTARSITWTGEFRQGALTLPTTTIPGRTIHLKFMWDSRVNKWDLIFKTENY